MVVHETNARPTPPVLEELELSASSWEDVQHADGESATQGEAIVRERSLDLNSDDIDSWEQCPATRFGPPSLSSQEQPGSDAADSTPECEQVTDVDPANPVSSPSGSEASAAIRPGLIETRRTLLDQLARLEMFMTDTELQECDSQRAVPSLQHNLDETKPSSTTASSVPVAACTPIACMAEADTVTPASEEASGGPQASTEPQFPDELPDRPSSGRQPAPTVLGPGPAGMLACLVRLAQRQGAKPKTRTVMGWALLLAGGTAMTTRSLRVGKWIARASSLAKPFLKAASMMPAALLLAFGSLWQHAQQKGVSAMEVSPVPQIARLAEPQHDPAATGKQIMKGQEYSEPLHKTDTLRARLQTAQADHKKTVESHVGVKKALKEAKSTNKAQQEELEQAQSRMAEMSTELSDAEAEAAESRKKIEEANQLLKRLVSRLVWAEQRHAYSRPGPPGLFRTLDNFEGHMRERIISSLRSCGMGSISTELLGMAKL